MIINLLALMGDACIPDLSLETDKTLKRLFDRFKLDYSDEQATNFFLKELDYYYDSLVGNITDMIHTYTIAQK